MIRRSLCACMGAAALLVALAESPHVVAKPPDLPMNETITVSAPESLYETLPEAVPTPTIYQLRPTARRTLVGSLLCGIHPALAFFSTEEILDAPHDHPQGVAGDDVFGDMPTRVEYGWVFSGGCRLDSSTAYKELDWVKWIAIWYGAPTPEQNEGYIQATGAITCPYLRQRKERMDRHACHYADPEIGRDVLDNLEHLKQADDLIEMAKALAEDGCVGEAMECCVRAEELCPGSPCADRAAVVLFDVCFGGEQTERGGEEAAEDQPETPSDSQAQGESDWELGLKLKSELDLIEAEWERVWFGEPSPSDNTEPGVAQEVRGLMKACHLLMNEGLHLQAVGLARQAFALDPERVRADPLVYKMHLLADSPLSHESSEDCEPPSCPYCPNSGKPIRRVLTELTGAEEESEEETSADFQQWIETMINGVGVDGDGGLRLSGAWSCGDNVYHLRYNHGCLAIWKTPDAAKGKP